MTNISIAGEAEGRKLKIYETNNFEPLLFQLSNSLSLFFSFSSSPFSFPFPSLSLFLSLSLALLLLFHLSCSLPLSRSVCFSPSLSVSLSLSRFSFLPVSPLPLALAPRETKNGSASEEKSPETPSFCCSPPESAQMVHNLTPQEVHKNAKNQRVLEG